MLERIGMLYLAFCGIFTPVVILIMAWIGGRQLRNEINDGRMINFQDVGVGRIERFDAINERRRLRNAIENALN